MKVLFFLQFGCISLLLEYLKWDLMDKYKDRYQAGVILARYLQEYAHQANTVVLALPRGGVPVAYQIAQALSLPLDVFIVRKLGMPGQEELALGAIASGNTLYFNDALISQLKVTQQSLQQLIEKEQAELVRREQLYRGNRAFPSLKNQRIILVDDGIATGATVRAAIKALREHQPKAIILTVPVAAYSTCEEMAPLVDKIVCPLKPKAFHAVGLWYESFSQTSDNEVIELLFQ